MRIPDTVRYSMDTRDGIATIADNIHGEPDDRGIGVPGGLTHSEIVEVAVADLVHLSERNPEQVVRALVDLRLQ